MTKKNTLRTRAGAQSGSKKSRTRSKKTTDAGQNPTQTRQPYEQDTKRRIGQFGGAGEPPAMR